jgi:hypothetical protein
VGRAQEGRGREESCAGEKGESGMAPAFPQGTPTGHARTSLAMGVGTCAITTPIALPSHGGDGTGIFAHLNVFEDVSPTSAARSIVPSVSRDIPYFLIALVALVIVIGCLLFVTFAE